MEQYLRGSTPYLECKVYNNSGSPVTPSTSVQVFITDPNGIVKQATASMSQVGTTTGEYYYVGWTVGDTDLAGIYTWTAVITDGTEVTKKEGYFEVLGRGTT